jgi:hypothetical protein
MIPVPLPEIDYFALSEAITMHGFSVHQTLDDDPEVHRFEFSDLSRDIHLFIYPLKGEVVAIRGLIEGWEPEEESFDQVPVPSEVRFPEYEKLFEILRRFAFWLG